MDIRCDRCGRVVPGALVEDAFSAGVYVVSLGSSWHEFARPGEVIVCEACMFADPRYVAVYGKHEA